MGVSLRGVSLFVSRMILPSFVSFYPFVLGGLPLAYAIGMTSREDVTIIHKRRLIKN